MTAILPEDETSGKRGYFEWIVTTPDIERITALVGRKDVINIGRTTKLAETYVTSIVEFHTACAQPALVLWRESALAKGGVLDAVYKSFHECKLLLAVATVAKMVYIRAPANDWEGPKQKREAIRRVKSMISSDTTKISQAN